MIDIDLKTLTRLGLEDAKNAGIDRMSIYSFLGYPTREAGDRAVSTGTLINKSERLIQFIKITKSKRALNCFYKAFGSIEELERIENAIERFKREVNTS